MAVRRGNPGPLAVDWPFESRRSRVTPLHRRPGPRLHRSKRKVNPPLLAGALGQGRGVLFCVSGPASKSYVRVPPIVCIAGPMPRWPRPTAPTCYALVTNIGETAKTKYRRRVEACNLWAVPVTLTVTLTRLSRQKKFASLVIVLPSWRACTVAISARGARALGRPGAACPDARNAPGFSSSRLLSWL